MNEYKKEDLLQSSPPPITISLRLFGWIVVSMVLLVIIAFMTGYFWGKKSVLETFCSTTERTSLSDHIYANLCGAPEFKEEAGGDAAADTTGGAEEQEEEAVESSREMATKELSSETTLTHDTALQQAVVPQNRTDELQKGEDQPKYYAELIGFGTKSGAQRFAARLRKNNIQVTIDERMSKTSRGLTVRWYQVITPSYDKETLIAEVNTIKQQERLHDVRIVAEA
jgi:hypothetical protein